MNVAQTALGIQIRNLEEELGVELLDRHSRGVTPTPAGAELDAYAVQVLGLLSEARQSMRKFSGLAATDLTLGLTPSSMRLVGDDILVDLARMIPNVTLHLVEEFSFILMRLLEKGEISCALTFSSDHDPRLAQWRLMEEDLFYLTSPDQAPPGDTIAFRDVLKADLALTGRLDAVVRLIDENAQRMGLKVNIAYEVQSIRAVKNLVAKGIAATVMPYGAAEGELRAGVLQARLITTPSVTRTLSFVYPKDMAAVTETPEFRAFVYTIVERLHAAPGPVTRLL